MRNNLVPRVSVLMPVYNAERYVAEAVESILRQTFTDFEFVIINDGSKDSSLQILQSYAARDSRIRLVSRENRGLVATLNEGVALARAALIARMDADDISLEDRLAQQVEYFESHEECVVVGSRIMLIDPEGLDITPFYDCYEHEQIDSRHIFFSQTVMCHPATMLKKEKVILVGNYSDEYKYGQDLDLFLRLAEVGILHNLENILFKYRMHTDAIGYKYPHIQKQNLLKASAKARKRRGIDLPSDEFLNISLYRRPSKVEVHKKWAWWALGAGNKQTAMKHALIVFRLSPFSIPSWKVLMCALRGY